MNLSIEDNATCVSSALFFTLETSTLRSLRVCHQIEKGTEVLHRIHSLQIRKDTDAFVKGFERPVEWCFRLRYYHDSDWFIPRWESPCRTAEQTCNGYLASFVRGSH